MDRIKSSPRLYRETADWYSKRFKSRNAGLEHIIEAFPVIFEGTLRELQGCFTAEELKIIISLAKKYPLGNPFKGSLLMKAKAKDGKAASPLFLKRLESLSLIQEAVLEIWASAYFAGSEGNLNKYIAVLQPRTPG